ncbi:XdhC family protein [candidate division KSB1 bacterium]|nr:XdhC family protein [candidate division KSB1 bacterium]MBL7093900.1 XdhC family protein [candidate division KSB1 bacterium]
MSEYIERIAELKSQGKTFCIITVVDSKGATPRKAGARAIVFKDGSSEGTVGGGAIEVEAFKVALEVLKSGKASLKHYELDKLETGAMICGGSMTLYYEPVQPVRLLTIFGGGHVGRALSRIASEAGWRIRIIDDRDGVFDKKYFPDEAEFITTNYLDYCKSQQFGENDWLAIVTPKHKHDESVLGSVINSDARYIGMMGSPKKVKEIKTSLLEKGMDEELLKKVHAPIGLNIGTETPGEIAVAIVGEMLAELYNVNEVKRCSK